MPLTIVEKPSPNHSSRNGARIRVIVLHADAAKNATGTITWLQNPASGVSYHYLIDRDGSVYRFVQDARKAWHAGKSAWQDVADVNPVSLGVSFANDQAGEAFTEAALAVGATLCADLCKTYSIPINATHITTHEAVARPPGRKVDPGKLFKTSEFIARVHQAASCV